MTGGTSTFQLVVRGRRLGRVSVQIPGRHNVLNAAAAMTAGLELGYPVDRPAGWHRGVQRHPAAVRAEGRRR